MDSTDQRSRKQLINKREESCNFETRTTESSSCGRHRGTGLHRDALEQVLPEVHSWPLSGAAPKRFVGVFLLQACVLRSRGSSERASCLSFLPPSRTSFSRPASTSSAIRTA